MAYMSQEMKKEKAPEIKSICKKYGVKATLAVRHHSTLILNVASGPIDFLAGMDRDYHSIHHSWIDKYKGEAKKFLTEVSDVMMRGNWDKSDIMTDYFNVGWYTEINIGKWNKPYILTKPKMKVVKKAAPEFPGVGKPISLFAEAL